MKRITLMLLLAAAIAVSACGAVTTPTKPVQPDAVAPSGSPWLSETLTDVSTGKSFKVADFRGKVVLVEMMAVWCSNCLQQQRQVQALRKQLGQQADLVEVTLDVDPNETDAMVKEYAARNNFDWTYAVAPATVARQIGQLYGDQFLNPSAVPMLIIDRKGQEHRLPFGIKSADSLAQALQPYLSEKP